MKKKIVALFLAGFTAVVTLTGCGQSLEQVIGFNRDVTSSTTRNVTATAAEASTSDQTTNSQVRQAAVSEAGGEYATAEDTCCDVEVFEEAVADAYYEPYYPVNNEKYSTVKENNFCRVSNSPLSTFAADVDTASYANMRRMINDGYRLEDFPDGSIRTEELLNYFDYNYEKPGRGEDFNVDATLCDCPWNEDTLLLTLGVKAREIKDTEDIPSNIVFLVDVSGSMDDYDKLPLLKMGFDMLVDNLDENDRVSIVTYASSSDIVIAGVPGDEHSKIKRAMNKLEASGSTNGGEGIMSAYKLAEKYFIEGGNNRIIMATDGDLNVGITSQSDLNDLISEKKEGGVFLSVLGFGTGNYNESALETLADNGNGNYSYIDSLTEAKKVLNDEFNSTLFTVAKDVKFQIEFNPAYVSEYRQIGYENRQMAAEDFDDDTKDGGEVGSGHTVTVMYELKLAEDEAKDKELRYQDSTLTNLAVESGEWMMVSVRYKEPEKDESKLVTFPVSQECYTKHPSCDTLFAAAVAETGMILNNSEYIGDLDISDVIAEVEDLNLTDEYREEFLDLITMLK